MLELVTMPITAEKILVDNDVPIENPKKSIKVKGASATVENYSLEDMKKLASYFQNKKGNGQLHYLALILEANLGIRNCDVLALRWNQIFEPNGKFRKYVEVIEKKTSKYNAPMINDFAKKAISEFIKSGDIDPSAVGYSLPIFIQRTGSHRGEVLTYAACIKAIKRAAEKLEISVNSGTHSARKFFGAVSLENHQDEYDSKYMVSEMLNHSSEKITNRYIGLTRTKKDRYYQDMGEYFETYVEGDEKPQEPEKINYQKIEDLVKEAYKMGVKSNGDAEKMIDDIASLLKRLEQMAG